MTLVMREFDCKCCGENKMTSQAFEHFVTARQIAKVPFYINSGYRCLKHNAEIEGSSPTSSHPKGLAADIRCMDSWNRWKILFALKEAGFLRIGIRKDFIHADLDEEKQPGVLWLY